MFPGYEFVLGRLEYIMLLNLPIILSSQFFFILPIIFIFFFNSHFYSHAVILPLGQQSSYLQLQTT